MGRAKSYRPMVKNCVGCKQYFTIPPHMSFRTYCSKPCFHAHYKLEKKNVKCPSCGKIFVWTSKHRNQKYCSTKCGAKPRKTRKAFNCPICGKLTDKYTNKKFCSNKCYYKSKEDRTYTKCRMCRKTFYYCPNRLKYSNGKPPPFCSRRCSSLSKMNGEYRNCKTCGTQFYISGWAIKSGHGSYCSRKCNIGVGERLRGKEGNTRGRPISEAAKEKIRMARAKQKFPSRDTSIEKITKQCLINLGIKFEQHFSVLTKNFLGQFDFAITHLGIAIECDGTYWHSTPRAIAADTRKNIYCKRFGWKLIRLPEQKIKHNISQCIDDIKSAVRHRRALVSLIAMHVI